MFIRLVSFIVGQWRASNIACSYRFFVSAHLKTFANIVMVSALSFCLVLQEIKMIYCLNAYEHNNSKQKPHSFKSKST